MGLFAPRNRSPRALTAASQAPDGALTKPSSGANTPGLTAQPWQYEAIQFYNTMGPLKFAGIYRGSMFRRVRLHIGVRPDDNPDGPPIPADDILDPEKPEVIAPAGVPEDLIRQAAVELARIRSPIDGQAGLLYDLGVNLTVTGDLKLAVEPDPNEVNGERWSCFGVTELRHSGQWPDKTTRWTAVGPPSRDLPQGTQVWRIYSPHPFQHTLADSSVMGVLSDLEELRLIQRSFRGVAKSRVSGAGLLTMPDELTFPSSDPDDPEAPDQFTVDLVKSMSTPLHDEEDATNIVPFLIRGPDQFIGPNSIRHIPFTRPADPVMDAREDKKIKAISIGLDTPVEIIQGIGSTNHWNGAVVSEESWKAHGEPGMLLICGQLATLPLRDLLKATALGNGSQTRWTGEQIAQIVIIADATQVVDHPDKGKDAKDLWDRRAISDDALRKANNFSDADAPDDEELSKRIEAERLIHARGAPVEYIPPSYVSGDQPPPTGTPLSQPTPAPGSPAPAAGGTHTAPASTPTAPARTAAIGGDPNHWSTYAPDSPGSRCLSAAIRQPRPVGHRLADLDLALYSRVHGMAQAAVKRQLEKAGARITSKVARNKVAADVAKKNPKHMVAAALGKPMVSSLGLADEELVGDYTDLLDEVDTHVSRTRQAGLAALLAFAKAHGQALSDAQLTEYQQQTAQSQQNGRTQLAAGLTGFTSTLLYNPDPSADDQGEGVAAGDVPPGVVRSALAVYGGQTLGADGRPTDDSSGVTPPLRSVAAGTANLSMGALLGLTTDAWMWQHGAPVRPFPPHLDLDGEVFGFDETSDSSRLANTDDAWLGQPDYSIGDHPGCDCSAVVLISADGSGGDGV